MKNRPLSRDALWPAWTLERANISLDLGPTPRAWPRARCPFFTRVDQGRNPTRGRPSNFAGLGPDGTIGVIEKIHPLDREESSTLETIHNFAKFPIKS